MLEGGAFIRWPQRRGGQEMIVMRIELHEWDFSAHIKETLESNPIPSVI